MGKKVIYTKITPLPKSVPRQLALDLLHSHAELIRLNPLVTGTESIQAPRDARADEYYSEWYLIHEIISWGPGMKKKMSFKGAFQNQPWGLQSHTYAPLSTDLRQTYRIGGNQPGEPPEPRQLGLDTPLDGLYLREDHEIVCAIPLTAGFVKKEMKAATGIMIDRLAKKAELLEAGQLHAMFEQGKLKTSKPNLAPTFDSFNAPLSPGLAPEGPDSYGINRSSTTSSSFGSTVDDRGYGNYYEVARAQSVRQSMSPSLGNQFRSSYMEQLNSRPASGQVVPPAGGFGLGVYGTNSGGGSEPTSFVSELPGSTYHPRTNFESGNSFIAELPGDYLPPARSPGLPPNSSPNPSHHSSQFPPQASPHPPSIPANLPPQNAPLPRQPSPYLMQSQSPQPGYSNSSPPLPSYAETQQLGPYGSRPNPDVPQGLNVPARAASTTSAHSYGSSANSAISRHQSLQYDHGFTAVSANHPSRSPEPGRLQYDQQNQMADQFSRLGVSQPPPPPEKFAPDHVVPPSLAIMQPPSQKQ